MSENGYAKLLKSWRPRVWWSQSQGVIEECFPRWPGEEPRFVRTRDRRVVPIPDDAVELVAVKDTATMQGGA